MLVIGGLGRVVVWWRFVKETVGGDLVFYRFVGFIGIRERELK